MNNIIKHILLPLILVLLMASCNKDPQYFSLESPVDQMKITASTEALILQKEDETKEAISFNWNKASDRGSDVKVVYYFRLYHSEMKDLQSELIKLGNDTFAMSWTSRQLNNLLNSWNILPGNEITVEAEILAVVENSEKYMKPETSKTRFNIIGYDSSDKLYLTVETNNQKRNIEMNMLDRGIYNWKGVLDASEFWLVRNIEKGIPAYIKGESDTSLIYSETGEGEHFSVDELGSYDITVDLNDLKIIISSTPISGLLLVTSIDGEETITTLNEVQAGADIFYLQDEFEAGTKFRFVRSDDNLWPAYVKGADDTKLELKEEGEAMFEVSKTATYVMTVNMKDLSLIFLDIYKSPSGNIGVVGDAIEDAGWDAGVAINNCKLTQTDLVNRPEVISYTGRFVYKTSDAENAFKFTGDENWGDQIFAEIANANPFDESQQQGTLDGDGDRKWQLPSGTTSGIYTLELNLHTMKVKLIK